MLNKEIQEFDLPSDPVLSYQIRKWLDDRSDPRGKEDYKIRPWLTVSLARLLPRTGLFMAGLITSAPGRGEDPDTHNLVSIQNSILEKGAGFFDPRQIWTFPIERLLPGPASLPTENEESAVRKVLREYLDEALAEHAALSDVMRPDEAPHPGQVVWIDIADKGDDYRTDLFALNRALHFAGCKELLTSLSLPCVVLYSASSRRAALASELPSHKLPIPLCTVIPLLRASAFPSKDFPAVKFCGDSWRVLVHLAMSVDFSPEVAHPEFPDTPLSPRVSYSHQEAQSALVTQLEFRAICDDVAKLWSLQ